MSEAVEGQEIAIEAGEVALPATLELPSAAEPVPCVVFFAGSGPTDRNWNSDMFPQSGRNGSAQQLAEALRAQGVGSVRFDKLGSGANRERLDLLSMQHYLDEGLAAYRYVSDHAACGRIFVLGSSEGGLHALRIAQLMQGEADFGGLITMSGAARSLLDTMEGQVRPQLAGAGFTDEQIAAGLAALRQGVEGLPGTLTSPPDFSAVPDLAALWQMLSTSGPPELVRELMTFDPLTPAREYRGPVLVVSADHDVQVSEADADLLFAAVPDAGQLRRRVTIANANHVYKEETRSLEESDPMTLMMAYWEQGRSLAPGTVETIVDFIGAVP